MKLWRQFISPLCRGHGPVSGGHVRVQFTGEPPANPSEDLIRQLVGSRSSISLGWLKEQIADALYHEGLRQGAWTVDIGIWGPAAFRKEAARILADIRPEFGLLVEESEAGSGRGKNWPV